MSALALILLLLYFTLSLVFADDNFALTYVGCFKDRRSARTLDGLQSVYKIPNPVRSRNMTVTRCAETCYYLNFTLAGLQHSSQCFCGSTLPSYILPDDSCDMMCSGNSSQVCGARLANSVYKMSSIAIITPRRNVTTSTLGQGSAPQQGGGTLNMAAIVGVATGTAVAGLALLLFVWRRKPRRVLRRVPTSPVVDARIRRSYRGTLERASTLAYNRLRSDLRSPPPVYLSAAEPDMEMSGQPKRYTATWVDPRYPSPWTTSSTSLLAPSVDSRVDSIDDSRDYTPRLMVRQVEPE